MNNSSSGMQSLGTLTFVPSVVLLTDDTTYAGVSGRSTMAGSTLCVCVCVCVCVIFISKQGRETDNKQTRSKQESE